jgi:hypothetical protein
VYPNRCEAKKATLYIVNVYSIHSDLLEFGTTPLKVKQRAVERLNLSEIMRDELMEFKLSYATKATERKATKAGSKAEVDAIPEEDGIEELVVTENSKYAIEKIITTIDNFLKYQDDPIAAHILRKKDHYQQVSLASQRMPIKNGEVDWDLKMKLNTQADKLMAEIEEWENKLKERNKALQPQKKEVDLKRKVFTSLHVEHAIH